MNSYAFENKTRSIPDPPIQSDKLTTKMICPLIVLVDASKSFEIYKESIHDGLKSIVDGLRFDPELQANHLTYLSVILFNTEPRFLTNSAGIVKMYGCDVHGPRCDFVQNGDFILDFYSMTDIGKALSFAKELGEKQNQFLKEKGLKRFSPMYCLFSDMINNTTQDKQKREEDQRCFEKIAKEFKAGAEDQKYRVLACAFIGDWKPSYVEEARLNLALIAPEGYRLELHGDQQKFDADTGERIKIFFKDVITRSASTQDIEDVVQKHHSSLAKNSDLSI